MLRLHLGNNQSHVSGVDIIRSVVYDVDYVHTITSEPEKVFRTYHRRGTVVRWTQWDEKSNQDGAYEIYRLRTEVACHLQHQISSIVVR
jgi:hypothetical protein